MRIQDNIILVRERIQQAEKENHRNLDSVLLLAVSKQQSPECILQAYQSGLRHFAENYWQEAKQKMDKLKALPLCWHFIGPIQSNKAKYIAKSFDWVHGLNRWDIAELLNDHRKNKDPLQVCLHINIQPEKSKAGIDSLQAHELAAFVSKLPNLKLRGLMTILPKHHNEEENEVLFTQLKDLMHQLNAELHINMDTLSMGMSDDFISAIKAGSTIVRIGRAIFGERK